MNTPNSENNTFAPRKLPSLLASGPRRVIRTTNEGDHSPQIPNVERGSSYKPSTKPEPLYYTYKRTSIDPSHGYITPIARQPSVVEQPTRESPPIQTPRSYELKAVPISSTKPIAISTESMRPPPPLSSDQAHHHELSTPTNLQDRVVVHGKTYIKLKEIGKGGTGRVYRVLDESNEVYALKCVSLEKFSSSEAAEYVNEVKLLRQLRGSPGIIYMVDYELQLVNKMLYIVMECGEVDLKKYLSDMKANNTAIDMNVIRLIWQQMLIAVSVIHKHNIIHSDLKPSNFLFVKSQLKLIDFGIARTISAEATSLFRENHVGTVNYISPEALTDVRDEQGRTGSKIRRSTDIWSLGCILYEIVYHKLPWSSLPLAQRLAAITGDSYEIPYPAISNPWLLDVIQSCLQRNPKQRPRIEGPEGLLQHPFLQPQGERARKLLKQQVMDNEVMREVLKQIREHARDERWKREGMVELFSKELVLQRARNLPVNVMQALENAEKRLKSV